MSNCQLAGRWSPRGDSVPEECRFGVEAWSQCHQSKHTACIFTRSPGIANLPSFARPASTEWTQAIQQFKEERMDADAKKTALRMIPYGLYVSDQ